MQEKYTFVIVCYNSLFFFVVQKRCSFLAFSFVVEISREKMHWQVIFLATFLSTLLATVLIQDRQRSCLIGTPKKVGDVGELDFSWADFWRKVLIFVGI